MTDLFHSIFLIPPPRNLSVCTWRKVGHGRFFSSVSVRLHIVCRITCIYETEKKHLCIQEREKYVKCRNVDWIECIQDGM
jgi:hypothetical protein